MLQNMTNVQPNPNRQRLLIGILLLGGVICLAMLWKVASASDLGEGDFTAYWSATYLLHAGQSPYDQAGMLEVQHTLINSGMNLISAWNPPTLFVFLLPLGWLPFFTAKSILFVVNVILLLVIAVLLTRIYLPRKPLLIAAFCVFVVLMPQALVGVVMGQVTFLVVLGIVLSLTFIKRDQWFWAGFVLLLTSIKPHMVILVVPYLLVYAAYHRRWQLWLGLFCASLLCMVILFLFRPSWIADLAEIVHIAPVNWATPTIGGFVSYFHITEVLRYLFVPFLPLAWFLARPQTTMSVEASVALLIIITVPTTFFGWSYDQTILAIPIAQLFGWIALSSRNTTKLLGGAAIVLVVLLSWTHRILTTSDVFYLWIPLVWAVVYGVYFARRALGLNTASAQPGITPRLSETP